MLEFNFCLTIFIIIYAKHENAADNISAWK